QASRSALPAMEEVMPEVLTELYQIRRMLEDHYRDMQDIEFTVQRGKLWMLQTRSGQRTAQAALKVAVALLQGGVTTRAGAVRRGRRGRPSGGSRESDADGTQRCCGGGRDYHDRRVNRRGDARRGADDRAGAFGRFCNPDGLGRRDPSHESSRQCRNRR